MDAIQESLNQMMLTFNKRLDTIEQQLPKPASLSSGDLVAEFISFKSFVLTSMRTLQSQIGLLANQVDTIEMRSRAKILLIHGLPESPQEETPTVLVKTIVKHFKLEEFKNADISRCHRMGRSTSTDRPRPILFKLRDAILRDKIWSSKSKLKGSGITVSEFLTKSKHDIFLAARQRFGVSKCWTRQGYVYVLGSDGSRHRVQCIGDLDSIELKPTKPAMATKEVPLVKETVGTSKSKRTVKK